MKETINLKLKKYDYSDTADMSTAHNPNMDIIDTEIKRIDTKLNSIKLTSKDISFDNSSNGMTSSNTQGAIEENKSNIATLGNNVSALTGKVNNSQLVKITEDTGACRGIPNNNANNINATGFWMNSNVANAPTSNWIYIESKVHNDLYQNQIATDLNDSSQRWTRHKTGGIWSSWRSL